MVGGVVVEVIELDRKRVWVNCCGTGGEYRETCAVYVDPGSVTIRPGDRMWWQNGKCYWHNRDPNTRGHREATFVKLSASGVSRPRIELETA